MRLTTYTDYTLRVAIYLSLKFDSGDRVTIDEIARAYAISHNHLTKIVHEMSMHGLIMTTRGRSGGLQLARPPGKITIGEIVRWSEPDFVLVECHSSGKESSCNIYHACNLNNAFQLALDAFLKVLDKMTLANATYSPQAVSTLLGIPIEIQKSQAHKISKTASHKKAPA